MALVAWGIPAVPTARAPAALARTVHPSQPSHSKTVSSPRKPAAARPAFTLIEMVAVIAILVILLTAGVGLLRGTSAQARRTGTDSLAGMIEQARTRAITTRSFVALAIAEPGDLPAGDERCRIGLFRVEEWPAGATADALDAVLMSRWQTLPAGIVLLPGAVDGVANPLDAGEITLRYGGSKNLSVKVHVLGFDSRGGLRYPSGSTPVAMRIAEGGYRNGEAKADVRGRDKKEVTENLLKIGRVTARPYRIDG